MYEYLKNNKHLHISGLCSVLFSLYTIVLQNFYIGFYFLTQIVESYCKEISSNEKRLEVAQEFNCYKLAIDVSNMYNIYMANTKQ